METRKGKTLSIFSMGLLLALLMLVFLPGLSRADYMADQFVTISQGDFGANPRIFSAKIYSQKKKLRMEVMIGGRRSVNISRGDKSPPLFWSLMPDEKMYTETVGVPEGASSALSLASKKDYEKVFLNKEPVAGIMTNKFKLVWVDENGNRKTGLAWEAIEMSNAPIRQEFFSNNQHTLVQLANIEVRKLDAGLFEIPPGYKKVSLPPGGGRKPKK